MRPISAVMNSKGLRKEQRREIRRLLGTSSDHAPYGMNVMRVAIHMDNLMTLVTNGRYRIRVYKPHQERYMTPDQAYAEANSTGFDNYGEF